MMAYIRNVKAALFEMVGQWAPVSAEATTRFRPMPWEIDRAGNIKPAAALQMAVLAGRSWQTGAGLGRAPAAVVMGGIEANGRFIAFESLVITTRLVEEAEGNWVLEHRIESDDQCARAVFITRCRMTDEGRWSLFTPKAPAHIPAVPARAETALRQAA